ncbi:MAG: hypothetical protein K6F85_00770 [Bacteroidales bacterium]|nr:hypothetical protein [Bacteroidales bacterium]
MIDQQKFEEMLNKYADGTLPAGQAAEVEAFMAAHPELLDDPDLRVTTPEAAMPDKASLKRRAAVSPMWRYAAAACVAAITAAGALLLPHRPATVTTSTTNVAQVNEPDKPTVPAGQPSPMTPIAPINTITAAVDPAVAPQPLLAAEPNIPAPQAQAAAATASKPRIVDTDALIAYSPDTIEVGTLVVYTSPLEGQPQWLEPVTTPVYNRLRESYSRIDSTMVAMASQPLTSILRK